MRLVFLHLTRGTVSEYPIRSISDFSSGTSGEFAACVVNIYGKFATGVVDIGGKFATSVIDTAGEP